MDIWYITVFGIMLRVVGMLEDADPGVGWAGSIEISEVNLEDSDTDILCLLSEEVIDKIKTRIVEQESSSLNIGE